MPAESARRLAMRCAACFSFLILSVSSVAAPLTTNSVLASFGSDFVGEFSRDGSLLQSIRVPNPSHVPGSVGGFEFVRDIELTGDGRLAIFNGTFTPYLTIWNPADNSFTHDTLAGWSSDGNLFFGRLAAHGNFVFASDNGLGSTPGVVRFDRLSPGTAHRIASINPLDLAVSSDGLLYVLGVDGLTVEVIDIETLILQRTLTLAHQVFGIAAGLKGTLIGASIVGGLSRFDSAGNVVETASGPGIGDIDIAVDGSILGRIVGFTEGVFLGDDDLSGRTLFDLSGALFVASGPTASFVVSEPPTLPMLVTILLLGARLRSRFAR